MCFLTLNEDTANFTFLALPDVAGQDAFSSGKRFGLQHYIQWIPAVRAVMSLEFLLLSMSGGGKDILVAFQQLQNPIFIHGLEAFEVGQSFRLGRFHDLSIPGV